MSNVSFIPTKHGDKLLVVIGEVIKGNKANGILFPLPKNGSPDVWLYDHNEDAERVPLYNAATLRAIAAKLDELNKPKEVS